MLGFGLLFSFGISTATAVNSTSMYVSNNGNDDWNGLNTTWTPNTLNGPKATIKNATGTIKSGGTIYVENGTYSETNIQILNNLSIIGQSQKDTIITGLKGSTFLIGKGATLNLFNMTIAGGSSIAQDGGGAIYNGGFLTVNGITFIKNYADNSGGAIYNIGTLNVKNSNFINNNVLFEGGAIANDGKMTVTDSLFTGNNANLYGGAIFNKGVATLVNNDFEDNTAISKQNGGCNGGAIYNIGSLTVTKSVFNHNSAMNNGGAIFNKEQAKLTINNSDFIKNFSVNNGYGGAVGNDGNATVTDTSFTLNSAIPGGAITNMGNLNVTRCAFDNNTAKKYGGAILNVGILNLNTVNFNNNSAAEGIGGAIVNVGQLTITGKNSFNANYANIGGAIFNAGKLLINSNSIFSANNANIGGCIYNGLFQEEDVNSTGNATIVNNTFEGNTANNGGAIVNGGYMTVTNSKFLNNTANQGGAIINGGNLLLRFNIFNANNAVNSGGAILNGVKVSLAAVPVEAKVKTLEKEDSSSTDTSSDVPSKLIIVDCDFINNSANDGGAICNSANMTVLDSKFVGNSAIINVRNNGAGGAISNHSAQKDAEAVKETAAAKDQAAAKTNTDAAKTQTAAKSAETPTSTQPRRTLTKSTISGCTFIQNSASQGSAIYNIDALDVHFCRIIGNSSTIVIFSDLDGVVNATLNWWGSNNNPSKYVSGNVTVNPWLVLKIRANPTTIKHGENSEVTTDLVHDSNGVYWDPVNGHVPDDIPVNFAGTLGTVTPTHSTTSNGQAESTYNSEHIGTGILTATVDNQTVSTKFTVNKASNLYMKITSSTNNSKLGEKFTVTYELGNKGPDTATNVSINIPLPEGFSISNIYGDGGWKYNKANNSVTWLVGNVPVGDPYLYITGTTTITGVYVFDASESSAKLTINVQDPSNNTTTNNSTRSIDSNKTIPMQNTGLPIAGLIFGVLSLMGGIITTQKK